MPHCLWLATLVERGTSESAVSTASQACLHIRTHNHDDINQATGLIGGDGELLTVSETVRDTVATLNSLELLRQGPQWTPRLKVRNPSPQDPVDFVRTSYPMLREVLATLARRLVGHVAVQVQGKTVCVTSVPMSDPLPVCTSLSDPSLGTPTPPATCVLCVWAAYNAQVTPQSRKFVIANVHHQA